jgi:hypothetical protein
MASDESFNEVISGGAPQVQKLLLFPLTNFGEKLVRG